MMSLVLGVLMQRKRFNFDVFNDLKFLSFGLLTQMTQFGRNGEAYRLISRHDRQKLDTFQAYNYRCEFFSTHLKNFQGSILQNFSSGKPVGVTPI